MDFYNMDNNQREIFFRKLNSILENKELIRLLLSNKRNKSSDLKNIIITIVKLKNEYKLSFVYRYNTKDITKNYDFDKGLNRISKSLEEDFLNADIYSSNENISLIINVNGKTKLKTSNPTLSLPKSFDHDKAKKRLIKTDNNIYLRELEIINAEWEVRREMNDKYKQINRYIEMLVPYLNQLSFSKDFHIADMGAGKGYLTFALYDYLVNIMNRKINMTGIELREDLVDKCNVIAEKSGFNNLEFLSGTIEKADLDRIDVLIALHACDTATDDAIFRGIKSGSSLIVCAPCCHKQIRKEMNVDNVLNNITKYGILKERQAEIITDTIRAMILELNGYKTNVFEFISTEHTPKNVMIVGIRSESFYPDTKRILDNIKELKEIFGIKQHYLERLLNL